MVPVVVKTYKLYIHTIRFCTEDLVSRSEDFPNVPIFIELDAECLKQDKINMFQKYFGSRDCSGSERP